MKTIILITLLLASIFCLSSVNADGMPSYNFEVQSAKMVSEGAYFYMEIENTIDAKITIEMFTEIEPTYAYWLDMIHIPEIHYINNTYYEIVLYPNKVAVFHFHAPYLESHEESRVYTIKFKERNTELRFRVEVLSLKFYTPQQDGEKYILKREAEWWKYKYDNLQEQNQELLEQNNTTLETLEKLNNKIGIIFVITTMTLILVVIKLILYDIVNHYKIKELHKKLGEQNE